MFCCSHASFLAKAPGFGVYIYELRPSAPRYNSDPPLFEVNLMRWLRYGALFCCLAVASLSFAQKEDWLPVTPQDLQAKEVPHNPGAAAIQLYYANFIDDNQNSEFFYHRIKILTDKGIS